MIIECENLKLALITAADLEEIREWRNALHVNRQMEYKEIIQPEAQQKWFSELDKEKNLYFKIIIADVAIGVVNLKNIDWDSASAEAGVFVGREDYMGTIAPILSVFIIMKVAFEGFQLEKLHAKISQQNLNALKFNQELGYKFHSKANDGFDHFLCTKEDFYNTTGKISKIQQLINKNGVIKLYMDQQTEWLLPKIQVEESNFQFYLL